MEDLTEQDVIDALSRGITVIKESVEKEGREYNPFEKELIESANTSIKKIKRNGHYFKHIVELVQKNYIEESIILTVTLFEFLMRDLVKDNKSVWFFLPLLQFSELPSDKRIAIRKKIKKYLEDRKLYDQYLINIHLYQDLPNLEIEALYHTLFDSERDIDRINFQNLSDKKGVKDIIKFLYDFNIIDYLDRDEIKAHNKWNLLARLIQERHNIIHKGDPATLKPEEIIEIINSIGELNHNLLQRLIQFGWLEIKKQNAVLIERFKIKKID
jgi:hypothetical protein